MADRSPLAADPPVQAEWDVVTCGVVALVTVQLTNPTAIARPIGLDNRLPGPVLPPRRHGVPEEGWDATGFTGIVPPGGRLVLGYACPLASEECRREVATSTEPPIEIRADRSGRGGDGTTAAAVVRDLGECRPPADAVPLTGARTAVGIGATADPATAPKLADSTGTGPPTAWLEAVEERVERAERLDGASVAEATALLRDGGVMGIEAENRRLRRDARRLDDLAARASALAARAEAVTVPVDALRRLA